MSERNPTGSEATSDWTAARAARWFFGVPLRPRTYANLAYLAFAFPLGLAYFVFLVVGFSVGASLLILLVGLPILLFVVFVASQIAAVERTLAEVLLDADIPADEAEPVEGPVEWLTGFLLNLGTWKGIVFLFSKFAIGIAAFVALVTGASFALTLLLAPLHYGNENVGIHFGRPVHVEIPDIIYQHDGWTVGLAMPFDATIQAGEVISTLADTVWGALLISAVGVLVALVVLHLFNALAWLCARYTELMLRRTPPSLLAEWRARQTDASGGRDR